MAANDETQCAAFCNGSSSDFGRGDNSLGVCVELLVTCTSSVPFTGDLYQ